MYASLRRSAIAAACCAPLLATTCVAQVISEPFNDDYSVNILGSVPGVPTNYGGLTFFPNNADTLLIGGTANQPGGLLYAIPVIRNQGGHITGFQGTASPVIAAPYNDGGVTFGPSNVLFLARWPANELGQVKPGSVTADKVIEMGELGVVSSLSALAFVPDGFPGAGHLKLVTYSGGSWYDSQVVADGNGTFDLTNVSQRTQIGGGPEGFVYVPPDSPQFTDFTTILVAEYAAGQIAAYQIDENGDPVLETRVDFLTGLTGAEGAVVDPVTGDFLFSTFGGSNQVVQVRGFGTPTSCAGCVGFPGCQNVCDERVHECRTCGHPFSNRRCVVNAVFVLQGALEIRECEPCTCDVDTNGTVNATDSLTILRSCAGFAEDLDCPGPALTIP